MGKKFVPTWGFLFRNLILVHGEEVGSNLVFWGRSWCQPGGIFMIFQGRFVCVDGEEVGIDREGRFK